MNTWRLYICSDCDTDEGVIVHQVKAGTSDEAGCLVDYCPGCGSYLSMVGMGDVEVRGSALVHLRMRLPAEEQA